MGAIASLTPSVVAVEPGGVGICELRVRNTGSVNDWFTFELEGPAAAWATMDPNMLNLAPGTEGAVRLQFQPPGDAGGEWPFAVKVTAQQEPTGWVVEKGVLQMSFLQAIAVELVPRTSRGWRGARHDLALDNRGNGRVSATLSAVDSENALAFKFNPPALSANPGTATYARVMVAARSRPLRGPGRTHAFQVLVDTGDGEPMAASATFLQEPLLASGAARAIGAVLMAVLLAVLGWVGVVRPAIEDKVEEEVARRGTATGTTGSATTPGPAGAATIAGTPIDGRLFLRQAGITSFQVPSGKTLQLTDIVLQNPGGNSGTLQLQRDGTALLVVGLDNFRDQDYHFVSPIVFTAGQKLELVANCTSSTCTPGAYFAGVLI